MHFHERPASMRTNVVFVRGNRLVVIKISPFAPSLFAPVLMR
jgi:hypothetical protein